MRIDLNQKNFVKLASTIYLKILALILKLSLLFFIKFEILEFLIPLPFTIRDMPSSILVLPLPFSPNNMFKLLLKEDLKSLKFLKLLSSISFIFVKF